jgi:hypothetical protein
VKAIVYRCLIPSCGKEFMLFDDTATCCIKCGYNKLEVVNERKNLSIMDNDLKTIILE